MKTMRLSLTVACAALLIFAVQVTPAEAIYKGQCDHWLKAASAAQHRGDKKGYQLAMSHYNGCTDAQQRAEAEAISAGLILGIGILGSQHGGHGHGHSHNNH